MRGSSQRGAALPSPTFMPRSPPRQHRGLHRQGPALPQCLVTHVWKHPAPAASQARDPKEIKEICSLQEKTHQHSGTQELPLAPKSQGDVWTGGAVLPSGSTPRPQAGPHPAPARGRGTNPALFSPLRPPGRDEVTGPSIKPGFLGPGHWGRAGPGARSGMLAGHPCSRTPKNSQVFLNSSYQFRAISGHRSQPCCQQLKIFWEGGTETRGKAARDGRRKKIRGRTRGGRKRAGAIAALFPLQPCLDASGKGVTLPPPPSPSPRAGPGHESL